MSKAIGFAPYRDSARCAEEGCDAPPEIRVLGTFDPFGGGPRLCQRHARRLLGEMAGELSLNQLRRLRGRIGDLIAEREVER